MYKGGVAFVLCCVLYNFSSKVKQYSSAVVNTGKDLYSEHASGAVDAIKSTYQSKRDEGRNVLTAAASTAKDLVSNNAGKAMREISDTLSENLHTVRNPTKRRKKGRRERIRGD